MNDEHDGESVRSGEPQKNDRDEQITGREEPIDAEEESIEEPVVDTSAPHAELATFIGKVTNYGLYPVVAYGLDPNGRPDVLGLATSPISDLPISLDLVDRTARIKLNRAHMSGMYIPLSLLNTIVQKNRIMTFIQEGIPGLNSSNKDHRRAIGHLIAFCTASRWRSRSFALVDIVGFSKASTTEQLALRMSLGQSINQVRYRMNLLHQQELILQPNFNRLSTGDGFYFFSWYNEPTAHITTFLFMLLLMAQTEALFDRTGLRLRAAFAIGEAYTFPYLGPGLFPNLEADATFMPDAIGPVLNDLQRLLADASPGQILVQHFDEPGRKERKNERLDISTMLTRVRAEILPHDLCVSDSIKSQDIVLEHNPEKALRVIDKHKVVHHCYNVWGRVPMRTEQSIALQTIGLVVDDTEDVICTGFRVPTPNDTRCK